MKRFFPGAFALACCLISCHNEEGLDFNTQLQKDIDAIDSYLALNHIDATKDASGIRYLVTSPGTGVKPALTSNISFKYVGKLLPSNQIFNQSDNGVVLALNSLITGFQIGVPLMNKGSKFNLYIPSGLGYGPGGASPSVPGNANLLFEVELLDDDAQLVSDIALIDTFLADSLHIAADSIHKDPTGLRYVFTTKAVGIKPLANGIVTVSYRAKTIPDQVVFADQTSSQLVVSEILPGLQTGLLLTPVGSQVTYYLPSGLAFGPGGSPTGVVKPNVNLMYEVNLISTN